MLNNSDVISKNWSFKNNKQNTQTHKQELTAEFYPTRLPFLRAKTAGLPLLRLPTVLSEDAEFQVMPPALIKTTLTRIPGDPTGWERPAEKKMTRNKTTKGDCN